MASLDKAVVLAAGLGNRISRLARDIPKPLLPLDGNDGPTFLDWHIWALASVGVREIYLVGNQRTYGTKLRAQRDVSVRVEWILNPTEDLSTSGSAHSAHFAFASEHQILDGRSRVVLMDADILYDPSLLQLIADTGTQPSKTLVCGDYRDTQEEVMVFADPANTSKPKFHGKGLLHHPLTTGCNVLGEATGILVWEPRDHSALFAATDWCMRYSTAKTRSEHEDVTQRMMLLGAMDAVTFGRDRDFMEVDTPEEYEVMQRDMFPRLWARFAR